MGELKWKTQDGRTIPLSEMTDSHLRHAASYMKARAQAYEEHGFDALAYICSDTPDGAAMAAEAESAEYDRVASICMRWVYAFQHELDKRGVDYDK